MSAERAALAELLERWQAEEDIAHIHGWDFSHIEGRYTEETDLPWSYEQTVRRYLTPEARLLDVDTGGGEFLLSLGHPHRNTAAMENYPPNIELCRRTFAPLGVEFRPGSGKGPYPFPDGSFDLVINRHGDLSAAETGRVLRPGGVFVTEQVGAENDRELVALLLGETPLPFPEQYLSIAPEQFERAGFEIVDGQECFRPIRFFDVGALVWFARIIQWEFPGFSVERCADGLLNAQRLLEQNGSVDGSIHRFLLTARKR